MCSVHLKAIWTLEKRQSLGLWFRHMKTDRAFCSCSFRPYNMVLVKVTLMLTQRFTD